MSALDLSEQDAFRRLQLTARERNLRLADVAGRIVEQQSLLEPARKRRAAQVARADSERSVTRRPVRSCYASNVAAFMTTPREAMARLFRVLRPEGKGNGLESFQSTQSAYRRASADTHIQDRVPRCRPRRRARHTRAIRQEVVMKRWIKLLTFAAAAVVASIGAGLALAGGEVGRSR